MGESTAKIISLEVSSFGYDDYCNIFEEYNNDSENIELRKLIDNLGFNIERPTAIITKANNKLIAPKIASSQEEIDKYMENAVDIKKLGLWTTYKYSRSTFEYEISKLFNHTCKIDYKIKYEGLDEIVNIRRIYTMSSRLQTVQMVEFILLPNDTTDNNKWVYFDISKVSLFKKIKKKIQSQIETILSESTESTASTESTNKRYKIIYNENIIYLDRKTINLYNIILEKYILAIHKIYDFYIEKDFEEIDDITMWEHELFQPGLHILEC